MKAKSVASIVLGLFVLASLAFMAMPKRTGASANQPSAALPSASLKGKAVVVYYFYDSIRCQTCKQIEKLAKQVLDEDYAEDLKAGRLVWRPINTDEADNEHYLKDYGIMSKSIVVSELNDGKQVRWSHLKRVWELIKDEAAFKQYIHDGVAEILGTE